MKQFSIIIPTLNEADNIQFLLQQISEVFRPLAMLPEILVIDDSSTDGTRQLVADYHGDLDVHLICRDSSRGLAGAVVAGSLEASHQHIVVMDADLSHPPAMIPALIEPLLSGTHDMVIGSRYIAGGNTPDWPVIRRLGSQLASIPARILTPVRDPLSGFFSVSREHLKNRQQDMAGFKIGLEILAENKGSLRVLEVPISFRDRFCGSSKMNFSVLKEYFYQLIRLSGTHRFIRLMPIFLLLGLITALLNYAFFTFLIERGLPLGSSHMLSLLGAVHICYPLSLLFHRKKQRNSLVGDYFRFLTVVLLGLFIRGGVLAFPILSNGSSPNLLAITLVATAFCIWMGAIITVRLEVFRLRSMNWKVFGTLLIGYTILLRLIFLGNIELIQE